MAYTAPVREDEAAGLARLAQGWEFPLAPEMEKHVLGFGRRLMEWNARVNLTGAQSVAEVMGEHVVDSFAMARLVPPGSSVVDVGAGGGLPGIPFSIMRPDTRLVVVEPRAKRVAFLRTVVRELQLANCDVLRGRDDALERGSFDVAASRATFSPEEWIGIGLSLVRPKGLVLVFAGDTWSHEDSALCAATEVRYATAAGRSRWLGAFCST